MNKHCLTAVCLLASAVASEALGAEQSLFDEPGYQSLVAETKAARVGDVLTVIVQESATATSTADLRGQRSFAVGAHLDSTMGGAHSATASTDTDSDGAGRTQRSGRLLAQVSVRVTEVLPNGDLAVAGRQSLKINAEEQLITLHGVVRPRDISGDNTIVSSRIAHARIEFDGEGFVTEQSKPGWLARFFALLGM